MNSLLPLFLTALAATPAAAFPADSPSSFVTDLRVGDVLRPRSHLDFNKRFVDNNDTVLGNVIAVDSLYPDSKLPRAGEDIVLKLRDILSSTSRGLSKRGEPVDCDEEECIKCGDKKFIFELDATGNEKLLSSGSDGAVYAGRLQDGTDIAIKAGSNTAVLKHGAEVQTSLQDGNTHIAKVYAHCPSEGINYYVIQELVPDGTIFNKVEQSFFLGQETLLKTYMAQVLDVFGYIHGKGIAHLDVKTDNVMLAGADIKVIDFDLSTDQATATKVDGNAAYRSPEGVAGGSIDTKGNDVWSLGIMHVEMLTGKRPWSDAQSIQAKGIWDKKTDADRVKACEAFFTKFTNEHCRLLADVFAEQSQRISADTFKTRLATTAKLLKDDACEAPKAKRSANEDEWIVLAVYDE